MLESEEDVGFFFDKVVALVESRKFFKTESMEEYVLVDRTTLEEIYRDLQDGGHVTAGWDMDPDRYFGEKDWQ